MQPTEPSKPVLACPNCKKPMASRPAELFYRQEPVDIDVCAGCNLLWFDRSECISMSVRSVLDLYTFLRTAPKPQTPPATDMSCPRCEVALAFTRETQRVEQFTYWRCRHGELMTFTQFLLRKQFLRRPSADEMTKWRTAPRMIACTQCGGSVNLAKDGLCPHCKSPITLLDPDGITKAVREMNQRASKDGASRIIDETRVRAAMVKAQEEALEAGPRVEYRDMFLGELIPNGLSKEENDRIAYVRRRSAEIEETERSIARRNADEWARRADIDHPDDSVSGALFLLAELIAGS